MNVLILGYKVYQELTEHVYQELTEHVYDSVSDHAEIHGQNGPLQNFFAEFPMLSMVS